MRPVYLFVLNNKIFFWKRASDSNWWLTYRCLEPKKKKCDFFLRSVPDLINLKKFDKMGAKIYCRINPYFFMKIYCWNHYIFTGFSVTLWQLLTVPACVRMINQRVAIHPMWYRSHAILVLQYDNGSVLIPVRWCLRQSVNRQFLEFDGGYRRDAKVIAVRVNGGRC